MSRNPYDNPTTPNDNCQCPIAEHWHGTHVCYVIDKCRCNPCVTANTLYGQHRAQWDRPYPLLPSPFVDAAEARAHVLSLMEQGMGFKRVARHAGVAPSTVGAVVWGRHDRKANRIRRATADRLLAVELDVSPTHPVDAAEALEIIDELVARGWSKAAIGRRVTSPSAVSLQLGRTASGLVEAQSVRKLRRLLFEPVPPRYHNRTGHPIRPVNRIPRLVPPSTVGVPDEPDVVRLREAFVLRRDREGIARALIAGGDSPYVRQLARLVVAQ